MADTDGIVAATMKSNPTVVSDSPVTDPGSIVKVGVHPIIIVSIGYGDIGWSLGLGLLYFTRVCMLECECDLLKLIDVNEPQACRTYCLIACQT